MTPRVAKAIKDKSRLSKEDWREYTKTVWHVANTTHQEHPAVFPLEIPHRLIKLFSWHGETVLDPFAGAGTTAKAAVALGRRAVCVDQNADYVDLIRRDSIHWDADCFGSGAPTEVVQGDSRDLSFLDDDCIPLVVSSPPYWNKANYGTSSTNLGRFHGYQRFLDEIRPVFEECYRVLTPGRKCCFVTANVNQHTDHGLLTFPLASDFSAILRNIGFVMVTEIIWSKDRTGGRWGSANAQRPIFGSYPYPPNFLFKNIHEHILVFAKPSLRKAKGPKVVPYDELMGLQRSRNGVRHS